jgi:teichuronic acid biosynthesis glycosyltransferase TuaG
MQLVSIIMPYYQKINYVLNAINSVVSQTYQNYELIIIYDDSDEKDLEILKKITLDNIKIRIIQNSKNLGAGYSRNIGIKKSKGEILSFIDADDEWISNKLELQLNFLNTYNYDFIFSGYQKIFKNKNINVISKYEFLDYQKLLLSCDIGLSTVMIRKKIIKNDLFLDLKTQEDFAAWLSITKNNYKAYNLKKVLVKWNYTKNSLSSNFFQKLIDAFKVYNNYQSFSLIKSLYYLLILSINSIKRKI